MRSLQIQKYALRRFFLRLLAYSGVGLTTFLIDISIIAVLYYVFETSYIVAVIAGFLIGVTLNYVSCYFWVYRGTERNFKIGFALFLIAAGAGVLFVTGLVTFLVDQHGVPLLIARSLVAGCVGLINFLINTFLNFKLL